MPTKGIMVNGKRHEVDADDDTPLLWILRDLLGLTGTKYGCGEGLCGACTVLEGDLAIRSCVTPLADAAGRSFTTIEGLSENNSHACQRAWLDEDVAQCGYCQPGMILAASALLKIHPHPTEDQIDSALADHVCRCGSYPRIRRAVKLAAKLGGER